MNSAFITFRRSRHFLSFSSSLICSMRLSRRWKETAVAFHFVAASQRRHH